MLQLMLVVSASPIHWHWLMSLRKHLRIHINCFSGIDDLVIVSSAFVINEVTHQSRIDCSLEGTDPHVLVEQAIAWS